MRELLIGERWNIGIVDMVTSPRFCLFATPSRAAFWRSVRGLFQIDSALALICLAGRDDADNFFAIWMLLKIHMDYQQDSLPYGADPVPTQIHAMRLQNRSLPVIHNA